MMTMTMMSTDEVHIVVKSNHNSLGLASNSDIEILNFE